MKIVVDTNRIIASMIKDSISKKILFNKSFEFVCPDYSLVEINKYKEEIISKANIKHEEFEILLSLIFEQILIVPQQDYENFLEEAKKLIGDTDIDDVSFIAVALALKVDGIWSDDPHFLGQNKVRIFKTKEMVNLI